ncbi:hypothetical protein [Leekyejoonella antrihumi]|uniref:Transmembrane protein n=1 Tax=Leekyejoonella antrihumi TaxID=1660198 RepID=A0A563E4F8_9MICO|nr:hypothetical protein [Leekyejoonella antrihumi]TWP37122.1 hypothetical protein FGL98_06795 [Leekyejoonella antrihumi]
MPVDAPETRTLIHLRTGSKICVMVATCLIAVAIYYYFVPVSVQTSSGGVFECGSAAHPPTSSFQKSVCEEVTHVDLYRTYLFAALGILTAALGCWFFGVDRTVEERPARVPRDAFDGDDDAPFRRRAAERSRRHVSTAWDDDDLEDDRPARRPRGDDDEDEVRRPRRRAVVEPED